MKHPSSEEWMDYLYGETPAARRTALKAHLADCVECRGQVDHWRGAMKALDEWRLPSGGRRRRGGVLRTVGRWAVAAVLLMALGYGVGQVTALGRPDRERLRQELEAGLRVSLGDEIRAEVREELSRDVRAALAEGYGQIKDELLRQYQSDLNEFAVQTLTASNARMNRLLTELILSLNEVQQQNRQWLMAALGQIETKREEEDIRLRSGLHRLAVQMGDELERTNENFYNLLAFNYPRNPDMGPDSENESEEQERSPQ